MCTCVKCLAPVVARRVTLLRSLQVLCVNTSIACQTSRFNLVTRVVLDVICRLKALNHLDELLKSLLSNLYPVVLFRPVMGENENCLRLL